MVYAYVALVVLVVLVVAAAAVYFYRRQVSEAATSVLTEVGKVKDAVEDEVKDKVDKAKDFLK